MDNTVAMTPYVVRDKKNKISVKCAQRNKPKLFTEQYLN